MALCTARTLGDRTVEETLLRNPVPPHERLIVALDLPSRKEALKLVEELGDNVHFYKLGLEMLMGGEYFELIHDLARMNKKVFVDLKFYDVPRTVAAAVRELAKRRIEFATVHGNDDILRSLREAKGDLKLLAVTVLTSLDERDLTALGFQSTVQDLVVARAGNAIRLGCDGIVASGQEARRLRMELGEHFLLVTPGIRDEAVPGVDDQKRTVDVETAFKNGADYVVVGRPIRDSRTPAAKAAEYQRRIAAVCAPTQSS